ncbi:hypothetical protein [Sulfurovum sp.]|uniref:hypothetical protein n=1 Tax=Sulfurovum sp. TaxID=1969726 RepID=UPI0035651497
MIQKYEKFQSKLKHLTSVQAEELSKRYYDGEKNSDLIDEYNIDILPNDLYKALPLRKHAQQCPYCETNLFSLPRSKSSYRRRDTLFCIACGHHTDLYCDCTGCMTIRQRELEARLSIKRIEEEKIRTALLQYRVDPVPLEQLSVKDKAYLGALLRACLNDDSTKIMPLESSAEKLAPTKKYQNEILNTLIQRNLISPDPEDVTFYELGVNDMIYISHRRVPYVLNVTSPLYSRSEIIEQLIYPNQIALEDIAAGYDLWKEIAVYESIEYLQNRLNEYQLHSSKIGDKTIMTIAKTLEDYSVSQVFNFLWSAVKNAAAFKQKSGISQSHAINSIPGNILKRHEFALKEGWDIKGYNRDYNLPQSTISEIVSNRILNIGDVGFKGNVTVRLLQQNLTYFDIL